MFVLVGLGNPGEGYVSTRHNIGFMAADCLAKNYAFSPFRPKFSSFIAEGTIGTHKVLLCKPQTFMNLSGRAVRDLIGFYKIPLSHLIVFHDDLDLDFGRLKVKQGGSSGGHNGLGNLDALLGRDYWRVRLGIGHPGHKDLVHSYVLGNFKKAEQETLCFVLEAVSSLTPKLLEMPASPELKDIRV